MEKLKSYRDRKKLSTPELAKLLGLSRTYTIQLLNGSRSASVSTAKQIEQRTGGKVKATDVLGL